MIKAVSDAGGRPVEWLHLREHTTLRTLATIERTTLVRRDEDTLRIYHADVRVPGSGNAEIPVALMERSQMTAVIIGPLQPHAIDALLATLQAAATLSTWRCPNLLFMLPPNAIWIANRLSAIAWPGRLRVQVLSESMSGASSVWNAMLGMWSQVKAEPGWATREPTLPGGEAFSIRLEEIGPAAASAKPRGSNEGVRAAMREGVRDGSRDEPIALDPARSQRALSGMLALDGLLGCALVDALTGLVLACEARGDVHMDLAAAACAQVLRAHRQWARQMGLSDRLEEVMTSAGPRHQIMRTLSKHPDLCLVVLLDKKRTNLALARFQLIEIERGLA